MASFEQAVSISPDGNYRRRWRARLGLLQDAVLIVVFAAFLFLHVGLLLRGQFTSLPFAAENGLLLGIYLTRRRSMATSPRLLDWFWAAGGGWLPLALQVRGDSPAAAEGMGVAVQMLGLTLVVISMGFLGRSFGIVAANRGLKTNGAYGLVRHPVYAAHLITATGFLLVNPHWINVVIIAIVVTCQVKRMDAEERVLIESADYEEYKGRVRFRLLPGVY